jgi:hypothetical protein
VREGEKGKGTEKRKGKGKKVSWSIKNPGEEESGK